MADKLAPHHRTNKIFEAGSVSEYFQKYSGAVSSALQSVAKDQLEKAFTLIQQAAEKGRRIYVGGNGGSAAISEHLCCDWTKGTQVAGKKTLKTHSLVSNSAVLTALANDYGFEECLADQLDMLAEKDDVLVLISSSGNSPNILKAAEKAKELGMQIIGLSGFTGGGLKKLANASLHVDYQNYGVVEDCHQMLMHSLSQFLALKRR